MRKKLARMLCASLVVLLVFPSLTSAKEHDFKDIGTDFWAWDEIQYIMKLGVANSFDDHSFNPNQPIPRVEAVELLVKILDLEVESREAPNFKDISVEHPSFPYIAAAVEEGIISNADKFNPQSPLTRAQMAKILSLAFELNYDTTKHFADVDTDHWAYDFIQSLYYNNITTGTGWNKFTPNAMTSRVQMYVFLARALDERFKPIKHYVNDINACTRQSDFEDNEVFSIYQRAKNGAYHSFVYNLEKVVNLKDFNMVDELSHYGSVQGVRVGDYLYFLKKVDYESETTRLFKVKADGSHVKEVAVIKDRLAEEKLTTDGSYLYFTGYNTNDDRVIRRIGLDGENETITAILKGQLPQDLKYVNGALYYHTLQQGNTLNQIMEIYKISLNGKSHELVYQSEFVTPLVQYNPVWLGEHLLFKNIIDKEYTLFNSFNDSACTSAFPDYYPTDFLAFNNGHLFTLQMDENQKFYLRKFEVGGSKSTMGRGLPLYHAILNLKDGKLPLLGSEELLLIEL